MDGYKKLIEFIRRYPKATVAFSGGVDSTLVLRAACDALGRENVLAVTIHSTLHGKSELLDAKVIAEQLGAIHVELNIDPLEILEVKSNSPLRCYYCKRHIFKSIRQISSGAVLDGTNASDTGAYRPGIRAIRELGVISPLSACGITKDRARDILKFLGMKEADKPSNSCLATRIPYNMELDEAVLARIDEAENCLRAHGYPICRVRVHGDLARIEVPVHQISDLAKDNAIINAVKDIGFTFVCLDLQGYRSGCYDIKEITE